MKQYYHRAEFIPPQLILPEKVEEQEVLETWLKENGGAKLS